MKKGTCSFPRHLSFRAANIVLILELFTNMTKICAILARVKENLEFSTE